MPDQPSRVRLQLAGELQTCRTLAGLTQRTLAFDLGISQSMLARAERGDRILSRPAVQKLLRTTKASSDIRDRVLALTEAAHTETRTWSDLFATQAHLQELSRERNATARLMQDFSPTVMPGLLQTAEYARRVIPIADLTGSVDHRAALAARIDRQSVLTDPGEREFEFLIAERLLFWQPAPGVLAAQLAQLIAAIDLANVQVAILPADYTGALTWHNFVVRYPSDGGPPYVATELFHGAQTITDPEDVKVYRELWTRLWDASATGSDVGEVIRAAAASV